MDIGLKTRAASPGAQARAARDPFGVWGTSIFEVSGPPLREPWCADTLCQAARAGSAATVRAASPGRTARRVRGGLRTPPTGAAALGPGCSSGCSRSAWSTVRCQCAVLLGSVGSVVSVVSVTAEATGRSVMRYAAAGHAPLANEPALTGLVTVGLAERIHFVTTVRNAASRSSFEAPAQQSSWNLRKSVKASARRGTCTPARGLRARVGGSLIGPSVSSRRRIRTRPRCGKPWPASDTASPLAAVNIDLSRFESTASQ